MADRDLDVFKTVHVKFNIPIAILLGGGNEVRILRCITKFTAQNDVIFTVYSYIIFLLRKVMSEQQHFLSLSCVKLVGKV